MGHRKRRTNDFSLWGTAPDYVSDDLIRRIRLEGVGIEELADTAGCSVDDLVAFLAGRKQVSRGTAQKLLRRLRPEAPDGR